MINLIGGDKGTPGAHAGDIKNRLLVDLGEEIHLVDNGDFKSGNFDANKIGIVATPISVAREVIRRIVQTMRDDDEKGAMLIMSGIMDVAGKNDVLAHCLFGPKALLNSSGDDSTLQHMMIYGNVSGEIDRILRCMEGKGIQIHETVPKVHNQLMTQVQVIPTLLQVGLSLGKNRERFIQDPAHTAWVTPTNTLQEMIELNDFSRQTVGVFNDLVRKAGDDLYTAFEELLMNVPKFAITPNCARVRDYLRRERPKSKGEIQKPYVGCGINSLITAARTKR